MEIITEIKQKGRNCSEKKQTNEKVQKAHICRVKTEDFFTFKFCKKRHFQWSQQMQSSNDQLQMGQN